MFTGTGSLMRSPWRNLPTPQPNAPALTGRPGMYLAIVKRMLHPMRLASATAAFLALATAEVRALNIVFDYTYDSGSFFSGTNSWRRAYLDRAAEDIEARIGETKLRAIIPTPASNLTWTLYIANPSDSGNPPDEEAVANRSIPANTLVIYVGAYAYSLGGSGYEDISYGETGGAAYSANSGSTPVNTNWGYTVFFRGQPGGNLTSGLNTNEFGPWGGSVSFANNVDWYFDPDPATVDIPPGKTDFYSVAVHEIVHAFGLGTCETWDARVKTFSGQPRFTGTNAVRVYGSNIPVITAANPQHWAEGVTARNPYDGTSQEAALDPSINGSFRKFLTDLDWAALKDLGWEVLPLAGTDFVILSNRVDRVGTQYVSSVWWRAQPGKSNQVLFATNLIGPFAAVSSNLIATNLVMSFKYTNASPRGFFRIFYPGP